MDSTQWLGRELAAVVRLLCTLLTVVMATPDVRVLEPEFNPVPEKMTYTRGDMARLLCSVSHLGERTIVWRKLPDPNPLTIGLDTWVEDRRLHVEHVHKHNQWNLVIEHVTSADEGDYECQVSMKEKSLRQVIQLEVIDVPVKRNPDIVIRGKEFVSRGGMIALVCNVTSLSDSSQNLQWVKDGNILTWKGYGGRISIVTRRSHDSPAMSSRLRVRDVTVDDAGDYTCRSSDLTHMTTLTVAVITGTGGASNNVKRGEFSPSGSMVLENCAVGCLPRDLVLVIFMFLCHYLIT